LLLLAKREQHVIDPDLLLLEVFGKLLRRYDRFLRLFRELLEIHAGPRSPSSVLPAYVLDTIRIKLLESQRANN
jgi:hypothetical protein